MVNKFIISPFQKFVKIESFSGILLFIATIVALVWANSSFGHLYESLWNYKIGINTQNFELTKPLILWVNDGLMAIFFFLIGLEIKRELLIGELNSVKKASLPLFAAIGGMLVPMLVFILLNTNAETTEGWGIPMATDIAFSLAILKFLGKRIPLSLKVFLTAFAIIDDIGAVAIIAIFYSENINWMLLAYAFVLLAILYYLSYRQIYAKYVILLFGIIIWYFFLKSGIHPTIAGVLLAFSIPIRQKIDIKTYSNHLLEIAQRIRSTTSEQTQILSNSQIEQIDHLEDWTDQVQSPLQQLENRLHNWVAYFIMPVFALSNAGVVFSSGMMIDTELITNLTLSLFLGKIVGIVALSYLGIKLKLVEVPKDLTFKHILGAGSLAGVGFTMSIFIANLAFTNDLSYMDSAKIGILVGSLISGLTGYFVLKNTKAKL